MKNLLSKEHYCCKIHLLLVLMKNSAYPQSIDSPQYMGYPPPPRPPPPFLQENLKPL